MLGMNLEQLKRDVGCRRRLVPPACHLDSAGDALPARDEEWTIKEVTDEYIEIGADSGHYYRLGKDHIRNFTTDIQRSGDGLKLGFLVLHVQLFVQGAEVRAVPNHQPGAAVAPPVNRAERARAFFAPELERVFRRQVQVLSRVVPNYSLTSMGKPTCPGDTWLSLKPYQPNLYATPSVLQDLSFTDTELLAEFYALVREVDDILASWIATAQTLSEYNAWNMLSTKFSTACAKASWLFSASIRTDRTTRPCRRAALCFINPNGFYRWPKLRGRPLWQDTSQPRRPFRTRVLDDAKATSRSKDWLSTPTWIAAPEQ